MRMSKVILELKKMPKSCLDCPFDSLRITRHCLITGNSTELYNEKRRLDCPLLEVKGVRNVLLDESTIEVLLREFISLLKQVDNLLKVIIINNATREISYSELLTITPGVQKIISELERLVKKGGVKRDGGN